MSILAAVVLPHPPIILPEVGQGGEKKIEKTTQAYWEAVKRIAELKPDTVIVTSPHSVMYSDYFHLSPGVEAAGDMGAFRAGKVKIKTEYDKELVKEITICAKEKGIPAGTLGEKEKSLDHGTMIPLYFLNKVYTGFRTVRIGLSGLSPLTHYHLGQCFSEASERLGRRTVVIASGDLSHKLMEDGPYGFVPQGPEFDRAVAEALASGDFLSLLSCPSELSETAAECGLRSFWIMAGALDRKALSSELLSYEGPFGVGYGVAWFQVKGEDAQRNIGDQFEEKARKQHVEQMEREDAYVRLARLSVEAYVKERKPAPLPQGLPEDMLSTRAGAFVSLKKHGRLRGCIGTISPTTDNVAQEILQNAISAASRDPRFDPVTVSELEELEYSVDVLGEPEEIDSPGMLNVVRYGVIVENGSRRGLLLPNLEGIDRVEEQIAIARQKAGIEAHEPVKLYRFEVVRHK